MHICFHSDNLAVVAIICNRSAKNRIAHRLLRCFYFYAAFYHFQYSIEYVPGVLNTAADALSRDNLTLFSSLIPQSSQTMVDTSLEELLITQRPDWGSAQWIRLFKGYLANALAPSTRQTYSFAVRRYLVFCSQFSLSPLPLRQETVARFISHLAISGVAYQSIRLYLSAIRYYQISGGMLDPGLDSLPWLGYVLRGIHRSHPALPSRRPLPITPDLMRLLFDTWSQTPPSTCYDTEMLWAACCMAFFSFMRAGEFTCLSMQSFMNTMLSPRDISIDSRENPTVVSVYLWQSKTDPFGAGVIIYLGRTYHSICPVLAILSYLARRGRVHGPLFLFVDGSPLSRQKLVFHLRRALDSHSIDLSSYVGHSFRVDTATAAALARLEDSAIRSLGRWRSGAFLRYIRSPALALASASHRLCLALISSPLQ